ncbi:MAG: JAB domain-containing protein, partial [Nitrospirota bacterium]
PAPSREDIAITERLMQTGEIVGIKVLDHVIIGDSRHTSLMDDGYMKSCKLSP